MQMAEKKLQNINTQLQNIDNVINEKTNKINQLSKSKLKKLSNEAYYSQSMKVEHIYNVDKGDSSPMVDQQRHQKLQKIKIKQKTIKHHPIIIKGRDSSPMLIEIKGKEIDSPAKGADVYEIANSTYQGNQQAQNNISTNKLNKIQVQKRISM